MSFSNKRKESKPEISSWVDPRPLLSTFAQDKLLRLLGANKDNKIIWKQFEKACDDYATYSKLNVAFAKVKEERDKMEKEGRSSKKLINQYNKLYRKKIKCQRDNTHFYSDKKVALIGRYLDLQKNIRKGNTETSAMGNIFELPEEKIFGPESDNKIHFFKPQDLGEKEGQEEGKRKEEKLYLGPQSDRAAARKARNKARRDRLSKNSGLPSDSGINEKSETERNSTEEPDHKADSPRLPGTKSGSTSNKTAKKNDTGSPINTKDEINTNETTTGTVTITEGVFAGCSFKKRRLAESQSHLPVLSGFLVLMCLFIFYFLVRRFASVHRRLIASSPKVRGIKKNLATGIMSKGNELKK